MKSTTSNVHFTTNAAAITGRANIRSRVQFIIPALLISIGLVACGGGGGGGGGSPAAPAPTPTPLLALFAGNMGGIGNVDGAGATARFNSPWSAATDSAGNVYVADSNNNTIRKITPAGVVSTLAGTAGVAGSTDTAGGTPSFYFPMGVATDSAGNVYVADNGNSTIRKITPAGVVSTFAGTAGVTGSTDTAGGTPSFNYPNGVATDNAGNVYVADSGNNTIRKITPAGVVTTLAGTALVIGHADNTGGAASFYSPGGVATDNAGNVYVADTSNHTIRKITAAGVVTTLAGTAGVPGSTDTAGGTPSFRNPFGVATDSTGNVYVADYGNSIIRKITPAGVVTTLAGTAGVLGSTDATGAAARFQNPAGVATDSTGNVYVADNGNSIIRKITPTGVVTTLAGAVAVVGSTDTAAGTPSFNGPDGVTTDSAGNVYLADEWNNTIRKITPAGTVTTLAGTAGTPRSNTDGTGAAARFNYPNDVATDSAGNVYVADFWNSTVRKITPAGVVTTLAGVPFVTGSTDTANGPPTFWGPRGVATDSAGNVYVADQSNCTIRKITPSGVVSTFAGTAGVTGSTDTAGGAPSFNQPIAVATDSAGNVYVSDQSNHTIRKITPAGVVSTLAGSAGNPGSADGVGTAARFNSPYGIATDSAGNVYVVDSNNNTIRKITPAGVVTTLVGVAGQMGFVAGALPGVLGSVFGVAVHGSTMYITLNNGVAVVQNLP